MIKITVNCDHCEKGLRYTQYSHEYYLCLSALPKKNNSGINYAMGISSPITEDLHFCCLGCLKKWSLKNTTLPEEIKND